MLAALTECGGEQDMVQEMQAEVDSVQAEIDMLESKYSLAVKEVEQEIVKEVYQEVEQKERLFLYDGENKEADDQHLRDHHSDGHQSGDKEQTAAA